PGGPPSGPAGRLASGPGASRGEVGAGSSPRAALPSRDGGPRHQQGQPGQQGQQNAGFQSAGLSGTGPQDGSRPEPQRHGGGLAGAFGNGARLGARGQGDGPGRTESGRPDLFGQNRQDQNRQGPDRQDHNGQQGRPNGPAPWQPSQPQQARQNPAEQGGFQQPAGQGEPGRQLPPVGGPRAELPGGNPQPQRPQTTSWGTEEPSAPRRTPLDAPRGHEDPESTGQFQRPMNPPLTPRVPMDDRQGPGSTAEFARPDFSAPAPQGHGLQDPSAQDPAGTAQFARPDFSAPAPQGHGLQDPSAQDPAGTAQFARPDFGQPPVRAQDQGLPATRQRGRDDEDFGAPRPPAGDAQYRPVLPSQPQPEALPPAAGPGDGRTPLYDTLETNWFHGPQQGGQQPPAEPQTSASLPQRPAPESPAPEAPRRGGGEPGSTTSSWRPSPNDELVRQAERVKKPAAGGVTTSGLPRRVPRANLVPGTAQQQNHQSGPQVSRAPDDVRGRLTNLRRGIQQGRQANNSQSTGSFPLGPTHQQER
ncbi:histidine kinase, partial [Streptomyces sp. NPDC006510]